MGNLVPTSNNVKILEIGRNSSIIQPNLVLTKDHPDHQNFKTLNNLEEYSSLQGGQKIYGNMLNTMMSFPSTINTSIIPPS